MTREEFLTQMLDVLEREEDLSFDMELADIEEWDSLAVMATMAFLHKNFGIETSMSDYKGMVTVEDIGKKAGL